MDLPTVRHQPNLMSMDGNRTQRVPSIGCRRKPGSRSVGRHGCTVAKEVAKPIEKMAAGHSCRLRDMAEPEEALDQPSMRNMLHLDSHIK